MAPSPACPRRRRRLSVGATAILLLLPLLTPHEARGQDGEWSLLPAGHLRIGITGGFIHGDQRFDSQGDVHPLATDLRFSNGAYLFPGAEQLAANLREVLGDPGYTPTLGATPGAYIQASQIRVPFTAEVGVTSWLTLGVTAPLVKSRVEGEFGLLPTAGDDLGVNPAFTRYQQVLAFTDQLAAAAGALPAGDSEVWGPWAARWVQAYAASGVFPAAGTASGDALLAALDAFNAVLAGAGVAPVTAAVPLADEVLTNQGLRSLLSDPTAHFQILPLPTQLLWALGDLEVHGRVRLVEGPRREATGRPEFGLTAMGSLRLPTGAGQETRALYDIPVDQGLLGFTMGGAGWAHLGRIGLGVMARYGITRAGEVERRVAPPDVALVPVSNLSEVRRSPGNTLEVELRPSLSLAPALTVEGFYQYVKRSSDSFEATQPLPQAPAVLTPFPDGHLYRDPSVLGAQTEATLHLMGGGLRFHPPAGEFPVEAWMNVRTAVAGSGGRVLKETRLEFGARATWVLWGR
ncbi:MAG TPA: hypothetical protein VLA43_06435 [Longimicrobiales bacterium]|nr:hypothetical protein [Longimicrobiales bacterium]